MERARHKETVITIAAGFTVLFLLFRVDWLLYIALAVSLIGITSNLLTSYLHTAWFWLADKMGFVMSKLILGVTFIFVLVPLGALSQLFRKDFMMLKRRDTTYYKERDHRYVAGDMKDPW